MLSKQQENQNLLLQADSRLKQEEDTNKSLAAKLETMKAQTAEMTRELIEATNAQSQTKLELKQLNQQLREKQVHLQEVEEALRGKDQATQSFKEEQVQMLHDQKAESMRVQEQLIAQNKSLAMERDSLEVRLKQLLLENQGHLEMIQQ